MTKRTDGEQATATVGAALEQATREADALEAAELEAAVFEAESVFEQTVRRFRRPR